MAFFCHSEPMFVKTGENEAMELALLLTMIAAGGAIAIAAIVAMRLAARRTLRPQAAEGLPPDQIAVALVVAVVTAGGVAREKAEAAAGRSFQATSHDSEIDVGSWAEVYARSMPQRACEELLERAVTTAMSFSRRFPLRQYDALLELTFGLGFHQDALARLRQRHGFEFEDFAKDRPASAGRRRRTPQRAEREKLLGILGLDADATRPMIISAYRRLVRGRHPDRFYNAAEREQADAARQFRELTEAYEKLLRDQEN